MRRKSWVFALAVVVVFAGIGGASAAAKKAKPKGGAMFGAITAQDWPVLFQATPDRRLIVVMTIVLDEKCSSGNNLSGIGTGDKAVPVTAGGAFHDAFTGGPISLPSGKTVSYSDTLTGKFNKARTVITGTWHETTTINDPAAGTSDTCDSGAVAFKAVD